MQSERLTARVQLLRDKGIIAGIRKVSAKSARSNKDGLSRTLLSVGQGGRWSRRAAGSSHATTYALYETLKSQSLLSEATAELRRRQWRAWLVTVHYAPCAQSAEAWIRDRPHNPIVIGSQTQSFLKYQ
jgi:hypothetical protein